MIKKYISEIIFIIFILFCSVLFTKNYQAITENLSYYNSDQKPFISTAEKDFKAYRKNNNYFLNPEGYISGPFIPLKRGYYFIKITGENLNDSSISLFARNESLSIPLLAQKKEDNEIKIITKTTSLINDFEIKIINQGTKISQIKNIVIYPVSEKIITSSFSLPKEVNVLFSIKDFDEPYSPEIIKYLIKNHRTIKNIDYYPSYIISKKIKQKNSISFISKNDAVNHLKNFDYYYETPNEIIGSFVPLKETSELKLKRKNIIDDQKPYSIDFKNSIDCERCYYDSGTRFILQNGRSFGPHITLNKGPYLIDIKGKNLKDAEFTLLEDYGRKMIPFVVIDINSDEHKQLLFNTENLIDDFEIQIINQSNHIISFNNISVRQISPKEVSIKENLPSQINRVFVYNGTINLDLLMMSVKNHFSVVDISTLPDFVKKLFLYIPNSVSYVSNSSVIGKNLFLYNINNNFFISKRKINGLKEVLFIYNVDFKNNTFLENGYDKNNERFINPQGRSFGPDITLDNGGYFIEIKGENLNSANFTLYSNYGKKEIKYTFSKDSDSGKVLNFISDKKINNFEIEVKNDSNNQIKISQISVHKTNYKSPSLIAKIKKFSLKTVSKIKRFLNKPFNYSFVFKNNYWIENGFDKNNERFINPQGRSFGPDITLKKGFYRVDIKGENLNSANYTLYRNFGKKEILYALSDTNFDDHKILYFVTDKKINNFEIEVKNDSSKVVNISSLSFSKIKNQDIEALQLLPKSVKRIFIMEEEVLDNDIIKTAFKNNIKIYNISQMPDFYKHLCTFIPKSIYQISKESIDEYLKKGVYLYKIKNNLFFSDKKIEGLKPDNKNIKQLFFNYIYDFKENPYIEKGKDKNNIRFLEKGGRSFGPYIELEKGKYRIETEGSNLDKGNFVLYTEIGKNEISYTKDKNNTSKKTVLYFETDKPLKQFEVSVTNEGKNVLSINKIEIKSNSDN
ncbi:hypothetical protein IKQ26_02965 [bacterium]|nr:hypothetical protein [bacterium]